MPLRQVIERKERDLFLFSLSYSQFRIAKRLRFSAFDLYKDQGVSVPGHDIDLAQWAAIITFQNAVTELLPRTVPSDTERGRPMVL